MVWIWPDKVMIHILGRIAQESVRFCYDTQNSVQFKKYELFFFFWNFPFNSFRLQVTGTVESKSKIKEGQLYIYKFFGNSFHWWVNALHLELGCTS